MVVEIEKLDHFGRGITRINNKICFIYDALPKEIVEIEIIEDHKKYLIGKVINYIEKSPNRLISTCPSYPKCGGCNLEHLEFIKENLFKRRKVQELLAKEAHINPNLVKEVIYTTKYNYRNKVLLHGKNKLLGYYEENTNNIIPINKCLLLNTKINQIINIIKNYNLEEVVIRTSNDNSKVILKITGNIDNYNELLDKVDVLIYNNKLISKDKSIITNIGNIKYNLSIDSFFQVNNTLTEKLYDKVLELVKAINPNIVLDLYCGCASIGIYISKYAKEVIGVEINKSSVEDALENIKLNDIKNVKIINSKVEDIINKYKDIDLVIVDPPRSGLSTKALNNIKSINPKNIIYVSCDPATLGRDLNLLDNYDVLEVTPFNMFPRTYHCESITVLERR